MSKFKEFLLRSYIYIILLIVYIPLVFAFIFSFNKASDKGYLSFTWNAFSTDHWTKFFEEGRGIALINSIIIALFVSFFVVSISLVTVFAMWRQKNKKYGEAVKMINNIPFINPDNITAIGLALVFALFFGVLSNSREGLFRVIVGHTVMSLPYGITLMYPRSDKFKASLYEASQDLGYSKIRSWFKTYFVYMIPSIIFVVLVSAFLSFDDFIMTRTLSNTPTIGEKLYGGQFKGWGLVIGTSLLFMTFIGNIVYISYKSRKIKKLKKEGQK